MSAVVLFGSCGSESSETIQENKYEVLIENSCGFNKDVINQRVYAFASDIDADNALEKIMKLTGLPPNFEIKSANVDNACAVVECDDEAGCKRIIYYNQEFIEKMNDATNNDYTELAILAHEIGHHLSGHTITEPKNRHEEELEADKFAGFILHQLGASIETAKNVFSKFPEKGSKTHPPRAGRIAAITNGWYSSERKGRNLEKVKSTTKSKSTVKDKISYIPTVKKSKISNNLRIGNQTWLKKNLDVNKFTYSDQKIKEAKSKEEWEKAVRDGIPAWCYYNNNPKNGKLYGKLYNVWAVRNIKCLCPEGYHIPSQSEYLELKNYAEEKLHKYFREMTIFTGPKEGRGHRNGFGDFSERKDNFRWWTSTHFSQHKNYAIHWGGAFPIGFGEGNYVRCLKD